MDSLEQLGALGALAETFDLDDSQLDDTPPFTVADWIDWIMQAHATSDGRVTVRTSGSTGHPQPFPHNVGDLLKEAAFFAEQLTDRRRVVALVPANHLYGIVWTALLPAALKTSVVVRKIGAPIGLLSGDLVVAVPEQWQAMSRLTRQFPDDVVGVSSAGPLDSHLATDLLALGLTRMIDVYGSSETSAIAVRDMPAETYSLLPRWQLIPSGDDWALDDGMGRVERLPDHIDRIDERLFRLGGRRDGALQVAGHNVWPERVVQALRGADGVADVAVRLHANGRLKAFVVPAPGSDPIELEPALQRFADERLSEPERPKSFRFGPALPRNEMGKLRDWA
ncbi:AMP-binding protein [Sphingomonas qomolangmaensis]|uniref:AMP-binding protein n=1 Tax=Sphingomonas qomolangmaensis TaxID=2918765 RepID=A0ABY5L631_9SPHN|nr:AMP-binding protein [Sphingomonas qomolangmaensis]UUL82419.1 AMP-binding protein [Sphingomonas qomolangmaensis]